MPNPTPTIFVPYHAIDDLHRIGTRAAQPVASSVTPGTLYCVTDEGNKLERSNGSIWQTYAASGAALPPNIAFTNVNNMFSTHQNINGNLTVTGGANVVASGGVFDLNRGVAMGFWQPFAYNAANFAATGGATWSVPAGNLYTNSFTIWGKSLIWQFFCVGSTITGIPPLLLMTPPVPPAYKHMPNSVSYFNNNGAFPPVEITIYDATRIQLARNDGASHQAGNLILHFTAILEIL